MSYIIKVKNTSGTEGTIVADAGFSYTDRLNEVNEGKLKITGTGISRRGLFETGSEVYIYRRGTLEFHGVINAISYLNAGGISADLLGYEVWLGKENGDYANSPWSSTASATIAGEVIAESTYFSAGTVETGEDIDFRSVETSSLWNTLSSLIKRTAQDIKIDYANSEVDILDHKGSSTSVETFNDGIQIRDVVARKRYPLANDVRVYGKSEGNTRIKSDHTTSGQDATSKSTYGTIRKIYNDVSVTSESEANTLADKLVAKWKDPIKVYEFDVINPNQDLESGDVITINSQTKGLSNEEVRIVSIERGIRNSKEFLVLKVTNKEYSQIEKGINSYIAELEKTANDFNSYDQYGGEYSNINEESYIGKYFKFCNGVMVNHCCNIFIQPCSGGYVCFTGCSIRAMDVDVYDDLYVYDWTTLNGNVDICGDLQVWGDKNAVVPYKDNYLSYSVIESPEVWFTDYCSGEICCGQAEIQFDERFIGTTTIDENNPYQVSLTPTSEKTNIYAEKHNDKIIVKGDENATFDVSITAKRKGYEDVRFKERIKPEEKTN